MSRPALVVIEPQLRGEYYRMTFYAPNGESGEMNAAPAQVRFGVREWHRIMGSPCYVETLEGGPIHVPGRTP